MSEALFFDTYAILEIVYGNKNYERYKNKKIVLTKLNMFELYYKLINKYDNKTALNYFEKYYNFTNDFDGDIIKEAAKLKLMFRKQDLSMTDCIGYITAKSLGIKFLTGDKQFEFLPDVEFVK